MVDLQKILAGMAQQAMTGALKPSRRKSSRSQNPLSGTQGKVIMGLLGLAVAAFEHYRTGAPSTGTKPPPPPPAGIPPGGGASSRSMPPLPSPPPPAPTIDPSQLRLLRIMVAAAHADGMLDPAERASIVAELESQELSSDERTFIAQELSNPRRVSDIVQGVVDASEKERGYAAACVAIVVDTDAEKKFLSELGHALGLTDERRKAIAREVQGAKGVFN